MTLEPLTLEQCEQVRIWRNAPDVLPMLRTKEPISEQQQKAFYLDVVKNPDANHRYFGLHHEGQFVGMGGLTYLDREQGAAEISLILGPEYRHGGMGKQAVEALRDEAARMGLLWITGECYTHSPAMGFWIKMADRYRSKVFYTAAAMFFRFRVA